MIMIESKKAKQVEMVRKKNQQSEKKRTSMKYIMKVDLISITTNITITFVIFVLEKSIPYQLSRTFHFYFRC